MPDEEAPPVVAVVVASDPGPWFEECLEALGAQDYPNLSVLVVDAGSAESPASRVAAVLPKAYLRTAEARGFGPSANDALGAVQGATHLLLCHDDVAPAPDAVRRMVEEAFRSNAGIVSPKYVAWHEADRLLQVGLSVDRFGSPVPRVEGGELDQSQHDEVREVFAAPGGCTLVRADLFEALGGYDPEISLLGEDVDLSWRAQVAGARVVVAPSATVRHLEATAGGVRQRLDKRALQRRHELRAVLKNYGTVYRWAVVPQMVLLAVLEIAYCTAIDDRARAREVVAAWRWNLARWQSLRAARHAVRRSRRLPDHVVAHLRAPARRPRSFISAATGRIATARPLPADGATEHERRMAALLHPGRRAESLIAAVVLAVVLVFGLRGLISSALPLVGGLAPLPSATSMLAHFAGGWTSSGSQLTGPAPPVFGLLGIAGILLGGATGLLLKLVLFVAIGAGAIGAGRLVAPFGSPRARALAAGAYVAFPLLWDDLARGDLAAVVAFGAAPYILGRLRRAARTAPLPSQRSLAGEVAGLAALLVVVGSFTPSIVVLTAVVTAATALGGLVAGDVRPVRRVLAVGFGGCAASLFVTLPWSVQLMSAAGWRVLLGAPAGPAGQPDLGSLLRFDIGPVGHGPLSWGLLAAATVVLLVGRAERFRTATCWWAAALASVAFAWAAVEGWLGGGGSASGVFLAPAAAALAGCAALGVVAFEQDLASYRFGWPQVVTAVGGVCAAAGALPFLAATGSGRASLPTTGYEQVLGYLDAVRAPAVPYRVLWVGDPRGLPLRGWAVSPGYAVGWSENGLPDATSTWASASPGPVARAEEDLALAREGLTVDVGAPLAQLGIRFVIVVGSAAPVLPDIQTAAALPPPAGLTQGLALQADLRELPDQAGSTVFVNADWSPGAGREPLAGATAPPLSGLAGGVAAAFETVAFLALIGLALRRSRRSALAEPAGEPVAPAPSAAAPEPADAAPAGEPDAGEPDAAEPDAAAPQPADAAPAGDPDSAAPQPAVAAPAGEPEEGGEATSSEPAAAAPEAAGEAVEVATEPETAEVDP